jgi:hypothetical protein
LPQKTNSTRAIHNSGIAGSSGKTISNFLRNRQIDSQSDCTSLQSHEQWRSVPHSPYPCQHLLSPEILILAILIGVRWNLRIVLICISLMTNDVEHFLDVELLQIFSQSVCCYFVLLTVSFVLQKLYNFMRAYLCIVDLRT